MIRLDPLTVDHFARLTELGAPSEVGLPLANLHLIFEQASTGAWLVRTIIDESSDEPIGLITIGGFSEDYAVGHMGTWLGMPYWGKGYNRQAKDIMLTFAFGNLPPLQEVFLSPKVTNQRALQALHKVPYVEIDVGLSYRSLQVGIERVRGPVILCRISRESFEDWQHQVAGVFAKPRSAGLPGVTGSGPVPAVPTATRGGTGPLSSLPPGAIPGLLDQTPIEP